LFGIDNLIRSDLVNAWSYVADHLDEIERQIRENEETWRLARLCADENHL
jgi:hypothetical protein